MTQGSQVRESCPAFCFTSILADHLRESRTALPWLPPRSVAWPCSGIGFGLTTHDSRLTTQHTPLQYMY